MKQNLRKLAVTTLATSLLALSIGNALADDPVPNSEGVNETQTSNTANTNSDNTNTTDNTTTEGNKGNSESVPNPDAPKESEVKEPEVKNTADNSENSENNNEQPVETPKAVAQPTTKPSKQQLEAVKKLAQKVEELTKAKDAEESGSAAGQALEVLLGKIQANEEVNKLYNYYTSLSSEEKQAYEENHTTVKGGDFKTSLEVNGKEVSGQNLFGLRTKRAAFEQAKAKQQATQEALQAQLQSSLSVFEEVAALLAADSGVNYTSVTSADEFKQSVANLKTKVNELEYDGLVSSADDSSASLTLTEELYKDVVATEKSDSADTVETDETKQPEEKVVTDQTDPETAPPADEDAAKTDSEKTSSDQNDTQASKQTDTQDSNNSQSTDSAQQVEQNPPQTPPTPENGEEKNKTSDSTSNSKELEADDSEAAKTQTDSKESEQQEPAQPAQPAVEEKTGGDNQESADKTAENSEGSKDQGSKDQEAGDQEEREEVEETSVSLAGVSLAEDNGSASSSDNNATSVANVTSALEVVEKLLQENESNAEAVKTLTTLKEKLTALQTALSSASSAAETANTEAEAAKTALVDYAKSIGLATADTDADTLVKSLTTALGSESSGTTLLAAIVAQQQAEALFNQLAAEQVLFAKVASAELLNQRNTLRNVRGEAQGFFASFFYDNNAKNKLETSYPALTLGSDYQITPDFKVGGFLTYSSAKFSVPNLEDYKDSSVGVSGFVDYVYHNYFVTLLAGYSHHSFGVASEVDADESYSSYSLALRGGYDFDLAAKGKVSLAGLYQYHHSGYAKLATHVFGVEGDYVYQVNNVDFSAGLGVYYQVHNKDLVKPTNYTQVVSSNLYDFSNLYKKSGVGVELSVGAKTKLDDASSFGVKASYFRDPVGGRSVNLNFDYRFKF